MRSAAALASAILVAGVGLFASACGGAGPSSPAESAARANVAAVDGQPRAEGSAPPAGPNAPTGKADEDRATAETRKLVAAMLERVAKARGLPIKREVKSRELGRPAMLARIREQVEKDTPMDDVARQGDALLALELIPPTYDFIAGTFRMIEGQIAGFYTPDDGAMYLADDLSEAEAEETLAHELVHALQDQSYGLGALMKYAPGDSDRLCAIHALVEGDATSAMLDVTVGSAFNVSESMMRRLLALSAAISTTGADTPRAIQASLLVPYADGFAFVQELRRRGGWKAVDAAWRALPQTTEQLLHVDKYIAREPPLAVAAIPMDALGAGFTLALDEAMGEQGLRIVLEQWTTLRTAEEGAAGWGGDRYVVARKLGAEGSKTEEIAVGWLLRFDTPADASEVAAIVKARFGAACRARPDLGPITWAASGSDVAIAAGPFERSGSALRGTGSCATAKQWVTSMLKAKDGPQGGGAPAAQRAQRASLAPAPP